MKKYSLISLIILLSVPILLEANDGNNLMPYQMITVSIDTMTERLGDQENKKRLGKNKSELYQIIDETLSPYFQKKYAGRLVLNNYWKESSKSQRERFTEGLYQSLIRSYAITMLNFDVSKIKVISGNISLVDLKKLTIKSEVEYKGEVIPMNFSFAKFKQGWMFYDVRIEGVSYIKNYRNQFNAEISANGLESVILRLESLKD